MPKLQDNDVKFIINNYPLIAATPLSKMIGTTKSTVLKCLRDNNIEIKPSNYFTSKTKNLDINVIKNLYLNDNKTPEHISKLFNCSTSSIVNFLKNNNIKLKTRKQAAYKGKKTYSSHGYVVVSLNEEEREKYHLKNTKAKYNIMEHRLVMSKYLNRPLESYENVHHKNGIKTDNRLENLELWITAQPTGQRIEDKYNDCLQFIERYKDYINKIKHSGSL